MEFINRPRRLRQSPSFRSIIRETSFKAENLMLPIFVCEGENIERAHPQLPSCKTYSLDRLMNFLPRVEKSGIKSVLLFGVSEKRDARGSEALNPQSALVRAIGQIRERHPNLVISTDIALDPYTDHGHDGLFEDGKILNDETVEVLCEMSLLHARSGAHMVEPSDMMDGRVGAIRASLDGSAYEDCCIMSYTAKYASSFYGPFRDTLSSKVVGDKKTYQMDPANRREAMKEFELDLQEGADILMVKPATHYLDIISDFRHSSNLPIAAYHVSGECALLELGAKIGLFDRDKALMEVLTSIFRAGAHLVATYYALEAAELLGKSK